MSMNEPHPQTISVGNVPKTFNLTTMLSLAEVRLSLTLHHGGAGFFTCCTPVGICTDSAALISDMN